MTDPLPARPVVVSRLRPDVLLLMLLLLASLCAVPLTAQNVTVPATLDGIEGGGGTSIPFGTSQACRYQCIYDAEELPWAGPRVITGVRIRPDLNNGLAVPAKGFLQVSVLMSTCPHEASQASADFEENYGSDATWVVQDRVIQLPAQPAVTMPSTTPRPANIDFPFAAPWAYGLTPVTQGMPAADSLLIEIWIKYQPAGVYRVDNLSSCVAPTAEFGLADPLCAVPGNQPIELTGDTSMLAGSTYHWRISGGPPSMPWLLLMNLTDQGGLLDNPAWPLPYAMFDPANPSLPAPALSLVGFQHPAPDCYLNISPAAMLIGTCDAAGLGTIAAAVPAGRQNVGAIFYTQALGFSPTSNPMWFITSKGRSTTVCGPLGVSRVYSFYDGTASPLPPATGTVSGGVGLVLEIY
ncbi:MAG: hypothetical protein H6835_08835 [Planctomycetes bacterium]|nr:hypothetical protein [Planctomycetota bacterium]